MPDMTEADKKALEEAYAKDTESFMLPMPAYRSAFSKGIAHARGEQEPVAYRYRHSEQEKWQYGDIDRHLWQHQPLYTAPPAESEELSKLRLEVVRLRAALEWAEDDLVSYAPDPSFRNKITDDVLKKIRAALADSPASSAAFLEALEDVRSHANSWREALVEMMNTAEPATVDTDDRGYWQHEINVFDRVQSALATNPTPVIATPSPIKPKVKALVWEGYPKPVFAGPDIAVSNIQIFGDQKYQVQRNPKGPGYIAFIAPNFGASFWEDGGFSTLEEAKAAAQSDYERCILSAIEGCEDE